MTRLKSSAGFLLGLTIIPFLLLNVVTLKQGQGWGDDYAQYIRHAKNIVEHKPYASGIMLDQGPVTPPGFPLLLAPLVKFFGIHFWIFKLLNVFCWLFYVLILFLIY